jgi:hypothetical protein
VYHTSRNGFASTRICKPRLSAPASKLTGTRKRAVSGLVIQITIIIAHYTLKFYELLATLEDYTYKILNEGPGQGLWQTLASMTYPQLLLIWL